jgi:hypothetical protein
MFGAIVSRTFIRITHWKLEHFPKPFHVQRREYEFWTGHPPNFSSAPDCGRRSIWTTSPNAKEGRLSLRDGDATVVDHVCTTSLGGHAVGTHTVVVDPLQRPSCSLLTRFTISRNGGGYAVRGGGESAGTYVAFDTLNELGRKAPA